MNQQITIPKGLSELDASIFLVRLSDKASGASRDLLHIVFVKELWKERFGSWSEFVESPEGLHKSKSWASKQLKIYEHYQLEGGLSAKQLEGVDSEMLYLGISLKGKPENKLAKISLWNRSEMKSELAVKENGEEHEHVPITICSVCHARL